MKIGQLLLSLISDIGLWAEYVTEPNPYGEATIDTLPEPLGASKDQIPRVLIRMSNKLKAIAANDTWLKDSPRQSTEVGHKAYVTEGKEFELEYYMASNATGHDYFVFLEDSEYDEEIRWWGFSEDWRIEGTEEGNNPTESQAATVEVKKEPEKKPEQKYKIPGITTPITRSQPIYMGSNFTWGEALWGSATGDNIRMPEHAGITANIVKLARYMDKVREDLGGNPIIVKSWYRDPATNELVRGARWSQHLNGLAIDFEVVGESVVDTFYRMKTFAGGKLSLAVGDGFVHLDLRPGATARWTYTGGPVVSLW